MCIYIMFFLLISNTTDVEGLVFALVWLHVEILTIIIFMATHHTRTEITTNPLAFQ